MDNGRHGETLAQVSANACGCVGLRLRKRWLTIPHALCDGSGGEWTDVELSAHLLVVHPPVQRPASLLCKGYCFYC